jgi:hypothetical protein
MHELPVDKTTKTKQDGTKIISGLRQTLHEQKLLVLF